jgi:sulfite reductase alpha subunit-like flavoprotein
LLSDLIVNQGAWIYVSGRAKFMPKSVEKAFVAITNEE